MQASCSSLQQLQMMTGRTCTWARRWLSCLGGSSRTESICTGHSLGGALATLGEYATPKMSILIGQALRLMEVLREVLSGQVSQ